MKQRYFNDLILTSYLLKFLIADLKCILARLFTKRTVEFHIFWLLSAYPWLLHFKMKRKAILTYYVGKRCVRTLLHISGQWVFYTTTDVRSSNIYFSAVFNSPWIRFAIESPILLTGAGYKYRSWRWTVRYTTVTWNSMAAEKPYGRASSNASRNRAVERTQAYSGCCVSKCSSKKCFRQYKVAQSCYSLSWRES